MWIPHPCSSWNGCCGWWDCGRLNVRMRFYKIAIIGKCKVLCKVWMIDLKNISANVMLINIVLSTFCIMDDKLKYGHLDLFLSCIELSRVSISTLLLKTVTKVVTKPRKNRGAEVGGLESYHLLIFGEQKDTCPFPCFLPKSN